MSDRPSAWDSRDLPPEDSGVLWLGELSLFLYRSPRWGT
jgi:hypothetical protein